MEDLVLTQHHTGCGRAFGFVAISGAAVVFDGGLEVVVLIRNKKPKSSIIKPNVVSQILRVDATRKEDPTIYNVPPRISLRFLCRASQLRGMQCNRSTSAFQALRYKNDPTYLLKIDYSPCAFLSLSGSTSAFLQNNKTEPTSCCKNFENTYVQDRPS